MALFWVKLCAKKVALPNCGDHGAAVGGPSYDASTVIRRDFERVHEIVSTRARLMVFEENRVVRLDLVPAHVRNGEAESSYTFHVGTQPSQPGFISLLASSGE